jgi:hypothetical protein
VGSARLTVYEGLNRVLLSGSVRRRALPPGRYVVRVRDVAGIGGVATTSFRIVKHRPRRR